jgi:hypothetical protein
VLSLAEADQLSETSRAQPLPIVSRLTPEKLESGLASEIAAKVLLAYKYHLVHVIISDK